MSSKRYPEEFKIEAVRPIVERGHAVAEVSSRLGRSQHSLYRRIKQQHMPLADQRQPQVAPSEELRRRS